MGLDGLRLAMVFIACPPGLFRTHPVPSILLCYIMIRLFCHNGPINACNSRPVQAAKNTCTVKLLIMVIMVHYNLRNFYSLSVCKTKTKAFESKRAVRIFVLRLKQLVGGYKLIHNLDNLLTKVIKPQ